MSSQKSVGERVATPEIGDVIVCAAFENGWRDRDDPPGTVQVTDKPVAPLEGAHWHVRSNAARKTARFVVEESRMSSECMTWTKHRQGGYDDDFEWDEPCREHGTAISARRLAGDGRYDPDGETVRFVIYREHEALREVRRHRERHCTDSWIVEAPIYKVGTMRRKVAFE